MQGINVSDLCMCKSKGLCTCDSYMLHVKHVWKVRTIAVLTHEDPGGGFAWDLGLRATG